MGRIHARFFNQQPTIPHREPAARRTPLEDASVFERATRAANGEKFRRLWAGDWEAAGYPSQSEADLALVGLLAYWTGGNAVQMDRLFRQSGLMRAKWDEPHFSDGRTYGQATLQRSATVPTPRQESLDSAPSRPMNVALAASGDDQVEHPVARRQPSLPTISVTKRHLHEVAEDAWRALDGANTPPRLFQRNGAVATVEINSQGGPIIRDLSAAALRGEIDRAATWIRRSQGTTTVPARPPKDVVEDMLAMPKPLPALRGVVGTPVITSNGELEAAVGYQPQTQLYYHAAGPPVPDIPVRPSAQEIASARDWLLQEWLGDFPFADDASRAHAVGAVISVLGRELIPGPVPLHVVESPTPGSGKGLLADTIGIIATGASPAVMTLPRQDDELRKQITSVLRDGRSVIVLDNITRKLASGVLAAVLTATTWSDRLLGGNETVHVPNRALWLATGNNVELGEEIVRRSVSIRLDPKVDRPWERQGFQHDPLRPWVADHRHRLVWAALVLVRHWLAEGRSPWTGAPLGSFEAWTAVAGGVLTTAGIDGFLANQAEAYARADATTEEWRVFVARWAREHAAAPVGVRELMGLVDRYELLPSVFATAPANATDRALRIRLGKALVKLRDRNFGHRTIRRVGEDTRTGAALWQLEPAETRGQLPAHSADIQRENATLTRFDAGSAECSECLSDPRAEPSRTGDPATTPKEAE